MGLKNYFKTSKPTPVPTSATSSHTGKESTIRFKDPPYESSYTFTPRTLDFPRSGLPQSNSDSSRSASRLSGNDNEEVKSVRSTRSRYLADIRHEVMVNHLFQQQCGAMWIDHNYPARCEGIMLRKARGEYLACPPHVGESTFAAGCHELSLHVSYKPNGT